MAPAVARNLVHMLVARQQTDAGIPVVEEKPVQFAAGPIIGVTAGAVLVILAIVFGIAFYMRRKRTRKMKESQKNKTVVDVA